MESVRTNVASLLLFLNLALYFIILGFPSWCLNRYINGQTSHPGKLFSLSLSLNIYIYGY